MAAPPLLPSVKVTVTRPLPGSTEVIVGAYGAREGVADTASEAAPAPIRLIARTFTGYDVPFTSDGIVNVRDVDPVVVQVVPLSVDHP